MAVVKNKPDRRCKARFPGSVTENNCNFVILPPVGRRERNRINLICSGFRNQVSMLKNVPVLGLAGYSGSGKTTFLEKLITELKRRGYRVGVIKHTHHPVVLDQPGKDTWRHARAGADVVALAAPEGVYLSRKFESDPAPEDVIAMIGEMDLILVEGYKKGNWPKLEFFRSGMTERAEVPREELLGVVSDTPSDNHEFPHFGPEDIFDVACLIERVLIEKKP